MKKHDVFEFMKAREAFEHIRNQEIKFSLRLRLILLVALELTVSVLLALGISYLLDFLLPEGFDIPLLLELLFFGLVISVTVTTFMSKLFFDPIKELRIAMEKVADGDFTVQLRTESTSKEIKEIFSGFNLMVHELNSTEVLQTDFVSNVSHEIKTPINAIEGYTTLLQGCENLDEDQINYVEKILFNTKRLSSLVGNILLLSKIENQSIETNQTSFLLDEQIRQSIVAAESSWTAKNIEFDADMEKIVYLGNEGLMRHVWDNLIGNAIKFSPTDGMIKIRLCCNEDKIIFTIDDNGPGFSEESHKHLFDKFYQGDSSHKQEGNGLGLALVKRIIAISHGEISAENTECGCRFTVILNK